MHTTDIEREIRSFLVDNFLFGRSEALHDDESLMGGVIDSGFRQLGLLGEQAQGAPAKPGGTVTAPGTTIPPRR